jgi:hypothetical protein
MWDVNIKSEVIILQMEAVVSIVSGIVSFVGTVASATPAAVRYIGTRHGTRLADVPAHRQPDEFHNANDDRRTIQLFQEIDPRYRAQAFKHLIDNDRTIENVLTHVDIHREVTFRYVIENQRTMDNLLLLNLSDENQVINFNLI